MVYIIIQEEESLIPTSQCEIEGLLGQTDIVTRGYYNHDEEKP